MMVIWIVLALVATRAQSLSTAVPTQSPIVGAFMFYEGSSTTGGFFSTYGSRDSAASSLCQSHSSCVGAPTLFACTYNESEYTRVPQALGLSAQQPVVGPAGAYISPSWNQLFNVNTIGIAAGPPFGFANPYYDSALSNKSALTQCCGKQASF